MNAAEKPLVPRAALPAIAIVAVALVGAAIFAGFDRGELKVVAGPATTSPPTTAPTAPTAPTIPTSIAGLNDQTALAVWPVATTSQRYDDPTAAAMGFATDLVGFEAPVLGSFVAGPIGPNAGTVDVRPTADGPVTTVQVAELGTDRTWWVTGSTTANIVVADPLAGASIISPVPLSGKALAFEGTVDVEVRADGAVDPIGSGYVTGSGAGQPGPFTSQLDFTTPSAPGGAVLFMTHNAENNRVWEATVVRVRFGTS